MKIRLVILLVLARSALGSTSRWPKKFHEVAEASDTGVSDDPEAKTRQNIRESPELTAREVTTVRLGKDAKNAGQSEVYDFDETRNMAPKMQGPSALARCEVTSFCIHGYPACLRQLSTDPQPDFSISRLRNNPRVILGHFDTFNVTAKAQRSSERAKTIARELLNQGIMKRWTRLESLGWARSKVAAWRCSKSPKTLRVILREPPRLFDVCESPEMPLDRYRKFDANSCFIRVLGNLLVLEKILQEDGATLETQVPGDESRVYNPLRAVKSVLEEEKAAKNSGAFDESKAFLTAVIRSMLRDGVLKDDVSKYPWAREFLKTWKSAVKKTLNDLLEKTYFSVSGGVFEKSCGHSTRNRKKVSGCCWADKIAGIMIVETELMRYGLSLKLISFDDQRHTNLVKLINRVLRKDDESLGVIKKPQSRRSATPEKSKKGPITPALQPGELADLLNGRLHAFDNKGLGTKAEHKKSATTALSSAEREKRIQSDRDEMAKKVAKSFDVALLLESIDRALGKSSNKSTLKSLENAESTTQSSTTKPLNDDKSS